MSEQTPRQNVRLAPTLAVLVALAIFLIPLINSGAMSWLLPELVVQGPAAPEAVVTRSADAPGPAAEVAAPAAQAPVAEAPAPAAPVVPTLETYGLPTIGWKELPLEAQETIALIDKGGPYPFDQDDGVFQNREGILPSRVRGYYREYTVITPGEDDRGARRIVSGGDGELYYTDDHYDSFSVVVR